MPGTSQKGIREWAASSWHEAAAALRAGDLDATQALSEPQTCSLRGRLEQSGAQAHWGRPCFILHTLSGPHTTPSQLSGDRGEHNITARSTAAPTKRYLELPLGPRSTKRCSQQHLDLLSAAEEQVVGCSTEPSANT